MQMAARMIDERIRRDKSVARAGPYIQRLRGGERNHWLVYTVAKCLWEQGVWDGLTRAGMRRALGRELDGADLDTVAQGWGEFLLAHRDRLPK